MPHVGISQGTLFVGIEIDKAEHNQPFVSLGK